MSENPDIIAVREYLAFLLTEYNDDLTPEDMADVLMDHGFINMHSNIPAQILHHTAHSMEQTIASAEIAEVVALPEGTVGVDQAVKSADLLTTDPAQWLHDYATSFSKDLK